MGGAEDDGDWPFHQGVLTKTVATTPFRGKTWKQRHLIAETELRTALQVPNRDVLDGKRVLVYDDVYTEGLTLREVARALRAAGAREVSEIVLARQPYGGEPSPAIYDLPGSPVRSASVTLGAPGRRAVGREEVDAAWTKGADCCRRPRRPRARRMA